MKLIEFKPIEEEIREFAPIFDFHRHIHESTPEDLKRFSIDGFCLMPSWKIIESTDFSSENPNDFTDQGTYLRKTDDFISKLKELKSNIKIYLFIPIDFTSSPERLSEIMEQTRAAGVKIHPLQGFAIDRKLLEPYIKIIEEHNAILYVHTDWVPSTEWKKTKNLMAETFGKIVKWFDSIPVILGHAGNNDSYLNIWKYPKKYKNVIVETSLSPAPQEIEKIKIHGAIDRVVFGSNHPFSSTGVELQKILKLNYLNREEKAMVLRENAVQLLDDSPYK